jgi:hypothetical protein
LFLLSNRIEVWKIYKLAATALTVSLVSAYGFGQQSRIFNGFSSGHPELLTAALGTSLVFYVLAFSQIIFTNPRRLESPINTFVDKL